MTHCIDYAVHLLLHPVALEIGAASLDTVSMTERVDAARYLRSEQRQQKLAAAAFRRSVLAGVLDVHPNELLFGRHAQGKPFVGTREQPCMAGVDFNLSHTREAIAIAVGPLACGVDVEHVGARGFPWDAAALCFSAHELALLERVGASEREAWAFALWTRKEAILKADGCGLLSVAPHEVLTGVHSAGFPFDAQTVTFQQRSWRVETRRLDGGWIVSLASAHSAGAALAGWTVYRWSAAGAVPDASQG